MHTTELRKQKCLRWKLIAAAVVVAMMLVSLPSQALVHPRLYDWQVRLSRLLPAEMLARGRIIADNLESDDALATLQAQLAEVRPNIAPEALELYTGIRFLIRQDGYSERYSTRANQCQQAEELLEKYQRLIQRHLKAAPPGQDLAELEPSKSQVGLCQSTPKGIYVLRWLPMPAAGNSKGYLHSCFEAAAHDLSIVRAGQAENKRRHEQYHQTSTALRQRLAYLCSIIDPRTGLLCKQSTSFSPCTTVEQLPPPPPLEFRTLRRQSQP